MSKTANSNIQKIERMQVEKVVCGEIHTKLAFIQCVSCKSTAIRRGVSAYTLKSRKSEANPEFDCRVCGNKSERVYSAKHDKEVNFQEYREILKEEI